MRDNLWLQSELGFLLKNYFSNIKLTNPIEIKFGREAQFRFGSIKLVKSTKRRRGTTSIKSIFPFLKARDTHGTRQPRDTLKPGEVPEKSVITITSMFAAEEVPVGVVRYTIAHELCHYAHGFSSYNKRLFKYPHHGGIVNRELRERGAEELIKAYKTWLATYRKKILSGRKIFS